MGKLQWNLWARAWVVAGTWSAYYRLQMLFGAPAGVAASYHASGAMFAVSLMFYKNDENKVPGPYLAYYLWAVSVVLFPFFWPLKFLGPVRILFSPHIVCCIICVLVAPFCFIRQPGVIPGFCYAVAAVLFFIATIRGEKRESLDELRGKAPAR